MKKRSPKFLKHPLLQRIRSKITKKRVAVASAILTFALIAIPIATYAHYAKDIGDKERLMNHNSTGIILRDKNGQVFYEFGKINGSDDLPLSQISDDLEKPSAGAGKVRA